jgi:signal transduction histidine kinase
MKPTSLRLRLLLGAAVWIALALLALGVLMTELFRSHVEASARDTLSAALNRLVAGIDPDNLAALDRPLPDPRYDLTYGGLYWQVENLVSGTLARSPSLFDLRLDVEVPDEPVFEEVPGPDSTRLFALSRVLSFGEGQRILVTVAEDSAQINEAVRRFASVTATALSIGWIGLTLAALLQVHLGLVPVMRVREGLERVRSGKAPHLEGSFPRELVPFVDEINTLLAEQNSSMAFARARAADLAHGLRTPLAGLQTAADRLRALGDIAEAESVEKLVESITERIEYQLRLSQLRLRSRTNIARAAVGDTIDQVVSVLRKTAKGETLEWQVEGDVAAAVRIDRHDFIELLGVILENAARYARHSIRITSTHANGFVQIAISDDGCGMTDAQIGRATQRGVRYDQTGQGSGLGLAIAADITDFNGGSLLVQRGERDGLAVVISLPEASADGTQEMT